MTCTPANSCPWQSMPSASPGNFLPNFSRTITANGDRDMVTEVVHAIEQAFRDFLACETPEIGFLSGEEVSVGDARAAAVLRAHCT
ncbi:hypothetical protein Acor_66570 [Acrocarpospora corrugata]|uniref:Uncharacterized protein n=1 Tax=Acrocarpospora corrugata TaxID=35763 RepID=A0A5M3W8C4_9ACTN|nr:hypothetical protein [Acrocarpospora corrugata]GES04589.1 hypothetical protein Acor_66570 [Acrocarpospora corrugata]